MVPLSFLVLVLGIGGVAQAQLAPKITTSNGNLRLQGDNVIIATAEGAVNIRDELSNVVAASATAQEATNARLVQANASVGERILEVERRQDASIQEVLRSFSATISATSETSTALLVAASQNTTAAVNAMAVSSAASSRADVVGLAVFAADETGRFSEHRRPSIPAGGSSASRPLRVHVGGHLFVDDMPNLYQCVWTHAATRTVARSAATAAVSASQVRCDPPAWPGNYTEPEWATVFTLEENGLTLPGYQTLAQSWTAEAPIIGLSGGHEWGTDEDEGITTTVNSVSDNVYRFYVTVSDADSALARTRVSATFTNASFVRNIQFLNQGTANITVLVTILTDTGRTNITITGHDTIGMNTSETLKLEITPHSRWTRIVRTNGNRHREFGRLIDVQNDAGDRYADDDADFGVYRAFGTLTGITHIRITKEDSRGSTPAGFAIYTLIHPIQRSMWYTMRHQCGYYDRDYTNNPSITDWTTEYSGRKARGNLRMNDRGSRRNIPYVYICGMNTKSDFDWSNLAFTAFRGNNNPWGDNWRGTHQVGTIWSMWNGDNCPRNWNCAAGFPGYKGSGSYNQGVYTISVCTDGNGCLE